MKDTGINNKHAARVATVALMAATALLAVSFEADSEIAGAVFYGAFVASVINAAAFFSYSLLTSDSEPRSRNPPQRAVSGKARESVVHVSTFDHAAYSLPLGSQK